MYKILNELSGIDSQLPAVVDDQEPEQDSEIQVYRIDEPEDDGDCGCGGDDPDSCECDDAPSEDPVEDLVDRFRDWLVQNVDVAFSQALANHAKVEMYAYALAYLCLNMHQPKNNYLYVCVYLYALSAHTC